MPPALVARLIAGADDDVIGVHAQGDGIGSNGGRDVGEGTGKGVDVGVDIAIREDAPTSGVPGVIDAADFAVDGAGVIGEKGELAIDPGKSLAGGALEGNARQVAEIIQGVGAGFIGSGGGNEGEVVDRQRLQRERDRQ